MQMCVQIVFILSVSTRTWAEIQANINIILSVRKVTFSPCINVLCDREEGKLFYVLHTFLHISTQQSANSEADIHSDHQEISRFLWTKEIHSCLPSSSPLIPTAEAHKSQGPDRYGEYIFYGGT